MDNELPESVGELRVYQEFYQLVEAQFNVLRTGPRVEFSGFAADELQRVREKLHKSTIKLARLEKKGKA